MTPIVGHVSALKCCQEADHWQRCYIRERKLGWFLVALIFVQAALGVAWKAMH